jgi:hypothetical protein
MAAAISTIVADTAQILSLKVGFLRLVFRAETRFRGPGVGFFCTSSTMVSIPEHRGLVNNGAGADGNS